MHSDYSSVFCLYPFPNLSLSLLFVFIFHFSPFPSISLSSLFSRLSTSSLYLKIVFFFILVQFKVSLTCVSPPANYSPYYFFPVPISTYPENPATISAQNPIFQPGKIQSLCVLPTFLEDFAISLPIGGSPFLPACLIFLLFSQSVRFYPVNLRFVIVIG